MKLNRIITLCAMTAALALSVGTTFAQDNGGPGGDQSNGGQRRFRSRNFDPAQFQQRMLDGIRERLGFTNDTDWSAVQPLVQKVLDARHDLGGPGMGRMMFGGRNRGGDQSDRPRRRGGMFGQPSPEAEALRKAVDDNVPVSQIKDLLAKYRASQKAKQAALETAQENLKKVLTVKQEAEASLMGLVD